MSETKIQSDEISEDVKTDLLVKPNFPGVKLKPRLPTRIGQPQTTKAEDIVYKTASDHGMIALRIPLPVATKIAIKGGEPARDLHVTLVYLGDTTEIPKKLMHDLHARLKDIAGHQPQITGRIAGYGRFSPSEDEDVIWVGLDSPDLPELRHKVLQAVTDSGIEPAGDHGFTPHITLAYVEPGEGEDSMPPDHDVEIKNLCFAMGDQEMVIPFTGKTAEDDEHQPQPVIPSNWTESTIQIPSHTFGKASDLDAWAEDKGALLVRADVPGVGAVAVKKGKDVSIGIEGWDGNIRLDDMINALKRIDHDFIMVGRVNAYNPLEAKWVSTAELATVFLAELVAEPIFFPADLLVLDGDLSKKPATERFERLRALVAIAGSHVVVPPQILVSAVQTLDNAVDEVMDWAPSERGKTWKCPGVTVVVAASIYTHGVSQDEVRLGIYTAKDFAFGAGPGAGTEHVGDFGADEKKKPNFLVPGKSVDPQREPDDMGDDTDAGNPTRKDGGAAAGVFGTPGTSGIIAPQQGMFRKPNRSRNVNRDALGTSGDNASAGIPLTMIPTRDRKKPRSSGPEDDLNWPTYGRPGDTNLASKAGPADEARDDHGKVENKGRKADYSLSASMYRRPETKKDVNASGNVSGGGTGEGDSFSVGYGVVGGHTFRTGTLKDGQFVTDPEHPRVNPYEAIFQRKGVLVGYHEITKDAVDRALELKEMDQYEEQQRARMSMVGAVLRSAEELGQMIDAGDPALLDAVTRGVEQDLLNNPKGPDSRKPRRFPDVGEDMGFNDTYDALAKSKDTVAIDFDGTCTINADGTENPKMRKLVEALDEKGVPVVIFTARPADEVEEWLLAHHWPDLPVTNEKSPDFKVMLDDRAAHFDGSVPDAKDLSGFKTWWEKAVPEPPVSKTVDMIEGTKLVVRHIFYGEDMAEARHMLKAHREADQSLDAALDKRPYHGTKIGAVEKGAMDRTDKHVELLESEGWDFHANDHDTVVYNNEDGDEVRTWADGSWIRYNAKHEPTAYGKDLESLDREMKRAVSKVGWTDEARAAAAETRRRNRGGVATATPKDSVDEWREQYGDKAGEGNQYKVNLQDASGETFIGPDGQTYSGAPHAVLARVGLGQNVSEAIDAGAVRARLDSGMLSVELDLHNEKARINAMGLIRAHGKDSNVYVDQPLETRASTVSFANPGAAGKAMRYIQSEGKDTSESKPHYAEHLGGAGRSEKSETRWIDREGPVDEARDESGKWTAGSGSEAGPVDPHKLYTAREPQVVKPTEEEATHTDGKIRQGHCFDTAVKYIAKHKDAILHHGSIQVGKQRIAHGWAEIKRADGSEIVYDGVQGKFYSKSSYYGALKAKSQHTYTTDQARAENKKSGHLGPWESDLEGLSGPVAASEAA